MKKQQLDDFEIEYGTHDETTNISKYGFTDKSGEAWQTWQTNEPGVEYIARRERDDLTIAVLTI